MGSGDLSKAKVRSPFDKIALSMTTSFLTKPIDAGESPSGEEEDDRTVEQKVDGMKLLGFRVFVALSDKSWMRVLDEPQKESLHNQTGITINTSGAEVTVSWDEKETKEADETKEKPNAITKGTIDALEAGLGPDYRDTLDAVGVKMDGNLTLDQINTFLADKEGPEADELKAFAEDLNDLGVKPSEPLGTALAELGEVELGVLKEKRESREGAAGEAPSETVDVNREAMEALNDPENGVYLVEYKGDDPLLQGMGTFLLVSDQSNLTKEGIDALLAEPSGQRAIVRPIDGVWSIVGAAGAEEVNESHASGEEALAAAKAFFEANPIADVGEVPTEEETTTEEGPEVQDEAIVKQIEALNNPT